MNHDLCLTNLALEKMLLVKQVLSMLMASEAERVKLGADPVKAPKTHELVPDCREIDIAPEIAVIVEKGKQFADVTCTANRNTLWLCCRVCSSDNLLIVECELRCSGACLKALAMLLKVIAIRSKTASGIESSIDA